MLRDLGFCKGVWEGITGDDKRIEDDKQRMRVEREREPKATNFTRTPALT